MANICMNDMLITGDADKVKALDDDFKALPESLLEIFPWARTGGYGICYREWRDDVLAIGFDSKWSPPTDNMEDLSAKYQVTIEASWKEPGNEVYGKATFMPEGTHDYTDLTPEKYLEEYNQEYARLKKQIQDTPYEEFLEEHAAPIDWEEIDGGQPEFEGLEKLIVARIKDEDLPLFMHVRWNDREATESLKQRIGKCNAPH